MCGLDKIYSSFLLHLFCCNVKIPKISWTLVFKLNIIKGVRSFNLRGVGYMGREERGEKGRREVQVLKNNRFEIRNKTANILFSDKQIWCLSWLLRLGREAGKKSSSYLNSRYLLKKYITLFLKHPKKCILCFCYTNIIILFLSSMFMTRCSAISNSLNQA